MSAPFARAKAMMAQIAMAMSLAAHLQGAALAAIGPYESRGKGKGRRQASPTKNAHVQRASIKAKNRAKHRSACRG